MMVASVANGAVDGVAVEGDGGGVVDVGVGATLGSDDSSAAVAGSTSGTIADEDAATEALIGLGLLPRERPNPSPTRARMETEP
jgi:hypothetical protein